MRDRLRASTGEDDSVGTVFNPGDVLVPVVPGGHGAIWSPRYGTFVKRPIHCAGPLLVIGPSQRGMRVLVLDEIDRERFGTKSFLRRWEIVTWKLM